MTNTAITNAADLDALAAALNDDRLAAGEETTAGDPFEERL